jgi:hypothetical protein
MLSIKNNITVKSRALIGRFIKCVSKAGLIIDFKKGIGQTVANTGDTPVFLDSYIALSA